MTEKICWHCGHYAFGCFVNRAADFSKTSEDSSENWCPEGTVTDMMDGVGSDETTWAENEYLQDDKSNL